MVFIAKNNLEEAVRYLRKSLEMAPENAEAYFNLGVAMYRQGNKPEAVKCWSRSVELKPDDQEAHYNLALVLDEQRDIDGAIAHYRRTVQLKPDHCLAAAWGSPYVPRGHSRKACRTCPRRWTSIRAIRRYATTSRSLSFAQAPRPGHRPSAADRAARTPLYGRAFVPRGKLRRNASDRQSPRRPGAGIEDCQVGRERTLVGRIDETDPTLPAGQTCGPQRRIGSSPSLSRIEANAESFELWVASPRPLALTMVLPRQIRHRQAQDSA